MFIQNFTCFSTSTFLSKNRQGNVNSFCIVQFSRSFLTSSLWFLSGDFVIISHLFEFVKRFFKLFSKFFELSCRILKKWLSLGKLIYYITFSWACQEVFQTFFKVFWTFLWFFKLSCPHLWRLVYYITVSRKSQPLFAKNIENLLNM